jgi:hypothetical protein
MKKRTNAYELAVCASLRYVARIMERTADEMLASDNDEIRQHGEEMKGAAAQARTWATGIEQKARETRPLKGTPGHNHYRFCPSRGKKIALRAKDVCNRK